MVSAYSAFANQGIRMQPLFITKVADRDGNVLEETYPKAASAIRADSAYIVTNLLRGVVQRGTGIRASRLGRPLAGKTGTTNDYKDAWFTGFTPQFTTSVWVGYDSNQGLVRRNNVGLTGSQGAAPIWTLFMKDIHQGIDETDFIIPEGVTIKTVDKMTGQPAAKGAKNSIQVAEQF